MKSKTLHHVIVGDGVAGITAAKIVRAKRPNDRITIISDDPQPYYYRAALTNYLMGELSDDELWGMPPNQWDELRIERHLGRVSVLDPNSRKLTLSDSRELSFDRLLIATGARARRISSPGSDLSGVFAVRTYGDIKRIIENLSRTKHATVLGGGILGLELCHGLLARNVSVSLIHRKDYVLDRVIPRRAAELIQNRMKRDGVKLFLAGGNIKKCTGKGRLRSIELENGTKIRSEMLVQSIGVVPNTEWLRDSGVIVNKSGYITVDSCLRVKLRSNEVAPIWAAGDVASVTDSRKLPFANPPGLWQPARKQGQIAGIGMSAMSDNDVQHYRPGAIYNATKAWDLDLGTLGLQVEQGGDESSNYEYETRSNGKPVYKNILVRNGRIVGACLLGDRSEGNAIRHLMNLEGRAGNISGAEEKILEPGFNLSGWVANRINEKGAQKYEKTIHIPIGPIPSRVASEAERTRQLELVSSPVNTNKMSSAGARPVILSSGNKRQKFETLGVKIGSGDQCHFQIGLPIGELEQVILTLEGVIWVARSSRQRRPQARLNDEFLNQPRRLTDGSVLRIGDRSVVVEIPDFEEEQEKVSSIETTATLVYRDREFPLNTRPVTQIGRSPDNDIVLTESEVSLLHSQIRRIGTPGVSALEFYLTDSGSQSGVFVNNKRISGHYHLQNQDVVRVGAALLHFAIASTNVARSETPSTVAPQQSLNIPARNEEVSDRRLYLLARSGETVGQTLQLSLPAVLGRGMAADVRVDDKLLSRKHVKFELNGGKVLATDLGSLNGVSVEGKKLAPQSSMLLPDGACIRLGQTEFIASQTVPSVSPPVKGDDDFLLGLQSRPYLQLKSDKLNSRFSIVKQRVVVGRDSASDFSIPDKMLSRRHFEVQQRMGDFFIVDLKSTSGTKLHGKKITPKKRYALKGGEEIIAGNCRFQFLVPVEKKAEKPVNKPVDVPQNENISPPTTYHRFQIDHKKEGDPLARDLHKVVQNELDSCIGCHECMRACPLPDSKFVTIAGLNALASGYEATNQTVENFVNDCTQCHACVPVCPVDIERSRIVLWNKLKRAPAADQKVSFQAGDKAIPSNWTLERWATELADHKLLKTLSLAERIELLGSARFRQLTTTELLVSEGVYPDAIWLVVEGKIEVGMRTVNQAFQRMIVLTAGQTIGETGLLADQPSDVTAVAACKSFVIGLPKYLVKSFMERNKEFQKKLESLYVSRLMQVFVKKIPSLSNFDQSVVEVLLEEFQAERFMPGNSIFDANEAVTTFAMVRRGFVKEIRNISGQEVVADYIKESEAFGSTGTPRRGTLIRFEAATQCEILTIDIDRLYELEDTYPGLTAALVPLAKNNPGSVPGQTAIYDKAAREGHLQASDLLVIDTRSCVDCDNCVSACERRHGAARLDRGNTGMQIGPLQVPASCYHCNDPVCLLCAVDGIYRTPTGEIAINEDNCIGCAACAERCPYDNIQMVPRDEIKRPFISRVLPKSLVSLIGFKDPKSNLEDFERLAVKCDLCVGFNNGPACVRSCPTGAAQRIADPIALFEKTGEHES